MEVIMHDPNVVHDGVSGLIAAFGIVFLLNGALLYIFYGAITSNVPRKQRNRLDSIMAFSVSSGAVVLALALIVWIIESACVWDKDNEYQIQQIEQAYQVNLNWEQENDICASLEMSTIKDLHGNRVMAWESPVDLGSVWLSDDADSLKQAHMYFMVKKTPEDDVRYIEFYTPSSDEGKWDAVKPGGVSEHAVDIDPAADTAFEE